MKAVDESIVDPTNEQVNSKDGYLSQKVGQGGMGDGGKQTDIATDRLRFFF